MSIGPSSPNWLSIGNYGITSDMDSARYYAQNATASAISYANSLRDALTNLAPDVITPEFPTVGGAPAIEATEAPELAEISLNFPSAPSDFSHTLSIDTLFPEMFDEDPPALIIPAVPTAPTDSAPSAPALATIDDVPDFPGVTLPSAPSLLGVNTYKFDGVDIPSFSEDIPELQVAAPSIVSYAPGSQYTSALLTSAVDTLRDQIDNGGTGLTAEAETALWNQAREREAISAADALLELDRLEVLGYSMPTGVYLDSRLKITTEMHARTVSLSRDIAIENARLMVETGRQALAQAVQLESTLLNYNNQIEQRAFDSARYETEAAVSIYNARVQAYAAFIDAYRVKVATYEAQIRGEMAKVEAYTAEMQAEQVKANVNASLVQQYATQVNASLAEIEIYKASVDAINAKAEIEKIKSEIYAEQIRGYVAKINGYTAQIEGFKSVVAAEATKQDAYKTKVDAYGVKVAAASKNIDSRIEEYKARLAAKTAEWQGYVAKVNSEGERARAISYQNSASIDAYKGAVAAEASYNEVLTKQWQASLEQAQRVAEIGVSAAKANGELAATTRSLGLDAAKVGAQVSAQIAAAALNAVSFSGSVSSSTSESNSASQSVSHSTSYDADF